MLNERKIVFVGAEWCGYCKKAQPMFDDLAAEHGSLYKFLKVNVVEEPDYQKNHNIVNGVNGFPTFVFMENGTEIGREVGYMSKEDFTAKIAKHFK
jgi:thioredoxin 1